MTLKNNAGSYLLSILHLLTLKTTLKAVPLVSGLHSQGHGAVTCTRSQHQQGTESKFKTQRG